MSLTSAPAQAPTRAKLIPVVEIFGPTIQGEGAEAGVPTHFVRVGGCDYRCIWCDTMYAVDPDVVRTTSEHLSSRDIVDRVTSLDGRPSWTTISGGNRLCMISANSSRACIPWGSGCPSKRKARCGSPGSEESIG